MAVEEGSEGRDEDDIDTGVVELLEIEEDESNEVLDTAVNEGALDRIAVAGELFWFVSLVFVGVADFSATWGRR
jgi:hypothetical protein